MQNTIYVTSPTSLKYQGKTYQCCVGKNGFIEAEDKKEGDGKTPIGTYPMRECWYRADRVSVPDTYLHTRSISTNDGWCDAPEDKHYNRHVTLPFATSHETLWREDNRYDIIIPLGYNDAPIVSGKGSAIFFHLASETYTPTDGCVAVSYQNIKKLWNAKEICIAPESA